MLKAAAGQDIADVVVAVQDHAVVAPPDQLRHGGVIQPAQAQLMVKQPSSQGADDDVGLHARGGQALEESLRIKRPAGPGDGGDDAHVANSRVGCRLTYVCRVGK